MRLLSIRYQLQENVKTTKLMIPISASNFVIFAFSLIIMRVFTGNLTESAALTASTAHSIVVMAPWIELTVIAMPLFICTFFCVSFVYSPTIRATILRLIGRSDRNSSRTAVVAAAEIADARNIYFRQLQEQWQGPVAMRSV
uniref:Uncharacterized protein n=1 Tax=Plectus sambesii TaxID=2011161 RepID=A0A914VYV9_9BILA